jgi:hypothetical protein
LHCGTRWPSQGFAINTDAPNQNVRQHVYEGEADQPFTAGFSLPGGDFLLGGSSTVMESSPTGDTLR